MISAVCVVCGKEFKHYNYRNSKYCGRICWAIRNPKIIKSCAYCNREISVFPSIANRKMYCSKECYSKHQVTTMSKDNSPLWKNGKTKQSTLIRTSAPYRAWRLSVYHRDNYTCVICGAKSSKGKRIYLHAHHVEHFADNPDKRFDLDNGITLCVDCHTAQHKHYFAAKRIDSELDQTDIFRGEA